tara:strand:+ start:237 stop:434 length:198 start_codon:yes stop_codon:yes gene_type:complete
MRYENDEQGFGEIATYYAIDPPKEIEDLIKCKGLLFTKRELDVAAKRYVRKGQPKIKQSLLDRFR